MNKGIFKQKEGTNMDILIAENLKKYYETGQVTVKALDGINLSVKRASSWL